MGRDLLHGFPDGPLSFHLIPSPLLKNVYNAAYASFSDSPTGTIEATILQNYGYRATTNVGLSIANDSAAGLSMTASYFSDYAFSFIPNQFYPIDSLLPSLIY